MGEETRVGQGRRRPGRVRGLSSVRKGLRRSIGSPHIFSRRRQRKAADGAPMGARPWRIALVLAMAGAGAWAFGCSATGNGGHERLRQRRGEAAAADRAVERQDLELQRDGDDDGHVLDRHRHDGAVRRFSFEADRRRRRRAEQREEPLRRRRRRRSLGRTVHDRARTELALSGTIGSALAFRFVAGREREPLRDSPAFVE